MPVKNFIITDPIIGSVKFCGRDTMGRWKIVGVDVKSLTEDIFPRYCEVARNMKVSSAFYVPRHGEPAGYYFVYPDSMKKDQTLQPLTLMETMAR